MNSKIFTVGGLTSVGALQFGDGYRTKRSEHGHPGYRIIRVADVVDDAVSFEGPDFVSAQYSKAIGTKVGKPGDILLTTKGTVGRVAVLPKTDEQVVYSPQLCFFRVLDPNIVAQRFLRYWFSSQEFWSQAADRMNNTDMAAYINLADIRSLQITLPDIQEQRAIAEVLGALDDKIAANTKLAQVSDQLAITMLSSLQPVVPLSVVVRYHKKTKNPESMGTAEVAHFSLPAFDAGRRPEVTPPTDIKSSKFSIEQPSVLISKLNPRFPRVWDVANVPDIPSLASTEFLVLEPLYSSTTFLWAMLSQPAFGLALESKVAGTSGSHQRVKPADLLDTPVLDPRDMPASLRDQVTSLGRRGSQARTESSTLTQIRNSLLPQLMSGKLQVKDAETVLEGAGV